MIVIKTRVISGIISALLCLSSVIVLPSKAIAIDNGMNSTLIANDKIVYGASSYISSTQLDDGSWGEPKEYTAMSVY